jgi:pentatricopeptide repeat protein
MKKNEQKIIPFPHLSELLMKKGMEAMEDKNYKDAYRYFDQGIQIEPEHEDINIGLALSLVELGRYQEAKEIVKRMMDQGIGEYFHVINIYLMILLQLNEHEEIIAVIEALFDEDQVPPERVESLENLLAMSKRIAGQQEDSSQPSPTEGLPIDEEEVLRILESGTIEEQLYILSSLSNQNIRPWADSLSQYLIEEKHPFLKTLVLSLLREQEVNRMIEMEKFGQRWTVNIEDLPKVEETRFLTELQKELSEKLEHNDPIMYDQALEMVKRHNILLYPLNIDHLSIWGEAYERLVKEAYGLVWDEPDEEIAGILEEIRSLEGITFPVI